MTIKQKVLELCDELNCTVYEDTKACIIIDAPDKHIFSNNGCHFFASYTAMVESIWDDDVKADLWVDILDRLSYGIEDCNDPDCEWCNND